MYLGTFSMFINPDFLEDLDPKDRDAIMSVSGEKLSALAGQAWEQADVEGLAFAREQGVNVIEHDENSKFVQDFNKLAEGMDQAWIENVADRDVDAEAALKELRQIAREYEAQKQK
jgi:TRAP-type C4-dicarboxylate transport system substrate-binding protein